MKRSRYCARDLVAWFFLITLAIVGTQAAQAQPVPVVQRTSELDARSLDNLVAFTRLFGYVRYFHPTDRAAATNWEVLAVQGAEAVEGAADAEDLARRLDSLFAPIALSVQIFPTGAPPSEPPAMLPDGSLASIQIIRWEHTGVGISENSIYSSRRVTRLARDGQVPVGFDDPRVPYEADLGGGVSARIPLTLFRDGLGTYPRPQGTNPYLNGSLPTSGPLTAGEQGGSIAIAWNIFQHFYPYFDVVETDWPAVLRQTFEMNQQQGHETALRYLVAQLHDGHGNVFPTNTFYVRFQNAPRPFYYLPISWEWVEQSLVVTAAGPNLALAQGDVITHLDGRLAAEVVAETEALISGATPQWKRYVALLTMLRSEEGAERILTVQTSDGQTKDLTLVHSLSFSERFIEPRPPIITELEPGIYYVDLDRVSTEAFNLAVSMLAQAHGIVFDMRGYPGDISGIEKLSHFTDEAMTSAQWHIPFVTQPDQQNLTFTFSNWSIQPRLPRLTSNIAYIIDGRAISYAETWMGVVEHYQVAQIVGQPTAGTNGNVNPFTVPSGYRFSWTGMKVLKHDGSQHHGVGILPTIPFERTLEGVRQGRDELLERAVQAVGGIGTLTGAFDVPETFVLEQNYPNPFNPATTITFGLPQPAQVRLDVFNMLGARVAVLVEGALGEGRHRVSFQPRDLPSGVYFYRLQAGDFVETRAMMLVR